MYDGVKKSNKEDYNYKKIKRSRRTKELTKRSSKTTENESSDEEQKNKVILTIEEELLKRKARVEVWRNKMRPKREDSYLPSKEYPSKAWTLDDENEEDDKIDGSINNLNKPPEKKNFIVIENNNNYHDMDEDDPLELYMQKVNDEAKSLLTIHQQHQVKNNKSNSKVQSTTLIRQSLLPEHLEKKPEVIEQNQDELEYLSDKGDNGVDSLFLGKQAKRKEIPAPNHELRNYQPFKKNFYVEVSELAKMIPEEVNRIRDEMDGIKVKGKKCPKPVKTWAQCGLSPVIHNVIKRMNFVRPTPIQAQAIPAIMSGRDIIGIAKTGSGKTLAFLLPMFRHIMDQPQLEVDDGPIGIVLTPTRELAIQTYRECRKFTKNLNLQVVCLYGGSCISEQIADLRKGAEIIICTPGRMIDMLAANNGRVTNCKRCTYLVLDEADRMFDLGFEPQVTKIVEQIRPDRQTVMFSATFPRQMELLARKILTKPMEIQVGGRSVVCSDIFQSIILIDYGDKFFKLLELLGLYQEQGSILVFVEKQNSADTLFRDLLKKGYPCLSLHGGMDQADRDSTICDFKNGVIRILVSTSIASRGLDVKNLVLVVNYDCPNHYEDYVHRVGRTGRAGNKGTAITFVTSDDEKYAGDLIKALELSNSSVPPELKDLWEDYCKRMKAEGIEIVKTGGGFSGKGYKFDADEAVQTFDKKIKQKWSLGMQNSDDEAEATEVALTKIEKDIDKAFVTKPKKITASQLETSLISSSTAIVLTNMNENKIATKINNCSGSIVAVEKPSAFSNILSQINNSKMNPYNTSSSTSQTSGGITTVSQNTFANKLKNEAQGEKGFTAAGMAKQIASRINMKLNYQAPEGQDALKNVLAVATGTDSFSSGTTEFYQSEIDINDFPQQVRWKLSSKETLASVAEVSEAMLTARGQYIPPGKEHEATDRRMHILIEGYREMHVQIARAEIRRILKEEMLKMESTHLKPCVGRYKIM